MQESLKVAAQILANNNIPNLPDEVVKLQQELNVKYPNTVNIANLISHNPELLSDFLSLVNTNLTEEKQDIKDAKAAVNVLGLDEIYNIFLAASLADLISQSYEEKQILLHSAKAGLAAAELSYWVYDVSRSEAYMAGLMQNIGAIYLMRNDPEQYSEIFQSQMSNPVASYKKETEEYKTNHTYLGTLVSKKWHIDPSVYKAILFHHDLDFAVKTGGDQKIKHLVALVIVGNYIVSATSGDQYITQEIKDYRDAGKAALELPDIALKAATAAVVKWGGKIGMGSSSH